MTHGHDPRQQPDEVDPTKQSGRSLMVTGSAIGLLLALSLMVVVYFLAR